MTTKPYITINEAAEMLDLNHYTIRRMISRGDLKAYRAGRAIRIRREDLQKSLKPVTRIGA